MPIRIDDEIGGWGITAARIEEQLTAKSGDIEVIIDSPGGDVFEGVQIYNALKAYDRGAVNVTINSLAASIASYIAMAGDTVKAMSNSTFMIHNVWTFAVGDHNDLRKSADVAEGLTHLLASAYAARTQTKKPEVLSMMDEETWLFGDEIKQGGFADEVEDVEEGERQPLVALAQERFKACRRKVKEELEEPPLEKMAALLARPEEPKIAASIMAKRFKLITGEDL